MSILSRSTPGDAARRSELEAAMAEYLELSRSPLRTTDHDWFQVAEEAAWDRLAAAARNAAPAEARA
jgi:hypothetical protein